MKWNTNIVKYVQKLKDQSKRREEKLRKQLETQKERSQRRETKLKKQHQRDQAKLKRRQEKQLERQRKLTTTTLVKAKKQWNKQELKVLKKKQHKETIKWRKEIKQQEKQQFNIEEGPKWKGSKKLGNIRQKLSSKLWSIHNNKLQAQNMTASGHARLVIDALRGRAARWAISGNGHRDPRVFLEHSTPVVLEVINSTDSIGKKVISVLTCKLIKSDMITGEVEISEVYFRSYSHSIITEEDAASEYEKMKEKMLESLSTHQKNGSGWRLHSVDLLEIFIVQYKPMRGKSYKPLPKFVKSKKAIINMENNDDQCFKWAVTRALNPVEKNPTRISKILKLQAEKLNWNNTTFPTAVKDISKFEKLNGICVNVLSYDDEIKKVYPLKISKGKSETVVTLFLYDGHYSVVENISRLLRSQITKYKQQTYICVRCFNAFGTNELLTSHKEICETHEAQKQEYPREGYQAYFKQYQKTTDVPFVIYADFESFILPISTVQKDNKKSHTTAYQKHEPSGFCYTVKCISESVYPSKTVAYTMKTSGEDIGKKFVESIEAEMKEIFKITNEDKPIRMNKAEEHSFQSVKNCYVCKEELGKDRVRDHCHLTGKYRGAAHNVCNLRMKKPKFIPVLFHNLEGYDSHLFVKSLGLSEGIINCIPKTDEKYISFSKTVVMETVVNKEGKTWEKRCELRFLDSLKFTLSSLNALVKNLGPEQFKSVEHKSNGWTNEQTRLLKQKGVFPYEFMDGFEKLSCESLPEKSEFYSRLNDSHISDAEYLHAQTVWKEFGCKTMRDYHDLYLKTDVLLLADVMERFRSMCKINYGLDPLWYYTSPGLAWDAALKMSGVKLDLLTDPDMYLMVERGIRGGISTITKRYAKANNKYMTDYNPEQESIFIPYLDENNLYGTPMTKALPVGDFKWIPEKDLQKWNEMPCILEVDLEYPKELHDLHNEYPLAAERITVNKVEKLIPNLNDKVKYVIHKRALKQCLQYGLRLTKIHRGITFTEKAWLKPYIMLNTELRTMATSQFEKDFFKLMNNSVFGKTMENVRNRVDIRLVTNEEQLEKLVCKPNFNGVNIFTENLVAVHMKKTNVKLNKPIYLGMSILEISKTVMYEFHYEYIKPMYGKNAQLLFTDTDSLCYEIKTNDIFKDISKDVKSRFDTSNFVSKEEEELLRLGTTEAKIMAAKIHSQHCKDAEKTRRDGHKLLSNHPSGIPTGLNKKVLGKMKFETGCKQISEFVGLRSKLYAYKMDKVWNEKIKCMESDEEKKCKGVKKGVVKNEITFQDYKDCLFTGDHLMRGMNTFRSRQHDIYTEHVNKKALSANDDKRVIDEDGITTYAIGHRRIAERTTRTKPNEVSAKNCGTERSEVERSEREELRNRTK